MKIFIFLSVWLLSAAATRSEPKIPAVQPEYLDNLLSQGRYDEFNTLMGIENQELAYPSEDFKGEDILIPSQQREQARQGVNFKEHPTLKWEGRVEVPYVISSDYSRSERTKILRAIGMWNANIDCIQFKPHKQSEKDYVFIFPGSGCYTRFGRVGGQQPLSLNRDFCLEDRIMTHELMHTVGFGNEQSRPDRDKFIKVLWENIPEGMKQFYEKYDKKDYGIHGPYDYYSVMHYPVIIESNKKPAFEVLHPKGIDLQRIGKGHGLTQEDIGKINQLYC